MRLIRWVGDPSPFQDEGIRKALASGRLPDPILRGLRFFENQQRVSVVPGKSELTLGPTHGFSRTYAFGPTSFEVWMEDADAARLLGNEWDRWQFLDVTEVPSAARPPLSKNQWAALLASFGKLGANRRLRSEYR
jgi:hypothetical protein